MKPDVTVEISTKGRYFTTLPVAIMSVINQTYKPKNLIIYDDGEHLDLRENSLYQHLFKLMSEKGINWFFQFGERKGQVLNHQRAIKESPTEMIWRMDDDDSADPDALEHLVDAITDEVGAIGSLVLTPGQYAPLSPIASAKIEDIYYKPHMQWFRFDGIKEADHLNNTFLFRKSAATHGYHLGLSSVGHREESIFTYQIKRNGWKVLIQPKSKVYHLREPKGGIRQDTTVKHFAHDDAIFSNLLKEWEITPNEYKLIVLEGGLGDHIAFRNILPEIKSKNPNKKIILSVCYPDVFYKEKDVEIVSIQDSTWIESDLSKFNIYKFMADKKWKDSLVNAYRAIYLEENTVK